MSDKINKNESATKKERIDTIEDIKAELEKQSVLIERLRELFEKLIEKRQKSKKEFKAPEVLESPPE